MPTYDFKCRVDPEHTVTVETRPEHIDSTKPLCCDEPMKRVFSIAGVVFKGSGFYRTDSRSKATSD